MEDADGWRLAAGLALLRHGLPGSIRGLIEQQVSLVSEQEARLLTAAAVYGEEFESTVLATALGNSRAETEEALQRLESVFLMIRMLGEHELPDGSVSRRYRFAHVLYQNVLAGTVAPARTELSGQVADALLAHYGREVGRVAGEVAVFFEQARRFQLATDYFLRAARNAAAVYANDEAIALTRRAARNAERLAADVRVPRTLAASFELAQLHLTLSDFESAALDFRAAELAAQEIGDHERQIEAICGGALAVFNRKRLDETRSLGLRALEVARRAETRYGTASAEVVLAMERMARGFTSEAAELVGRAQPVLMADSPDPTPMHAIEGVSYCAAHFGWQADYGSAFPPIEWALERARSRGVCFHIVGCLFIKALGLGGAGHFSSSQRCLEEGTHLAELNSERYWLPRLPNTLGCVYGEMQDFEQALRLNTEGTQMALEMGFEEGAINAHTNLAGLLVTLGDLDGAWEHLSEARRLTETEHWFRWVYVVRLEVQHARYWIARGKPAAARSHALATLKIAEPARKTKHVALGHQLLGDAAAMEERAEEAAAEYQKALAALAIHPCPSAEWPILVSLAETRRRLHREEGPDLRAKAREIVGTLAEGIEDARLRRVFERSEALAAIRA